MYTNNDCEISGISVCVPKKQINNKKFLKLKEKNEFIQHTGVSKHFLDLNLPINLKKHFEKKNVRNIIKFMRIDKKNYNSKINLILISKIGKCLPARNFSEKEMFQLLNESVSSDDIAHIVSKWTGIPIERMVENDNNTSSFKYDR